MMHAQGCQGPTCASDPEPRVGVCLLRVCRATVRRVEPGGAVDTRLSAWEVGLFNKEVIQ
ncbi:MAG: hypothetical protein U0640_12770 [Phycisphaerales bacterium]